MKILFLNGYQNARGAETFIFELSLRLKRDNIVHLISGDKKIPRRWPILWRLYLDPHGFYTFFFTLRNIFKIIRGNYDIIVPINGGWQPAIIRIVTWFTGGKMVISGQSGRGWDDRNNLWCFPDSFVALSSFAKRWANKVNPFVRIDYIPNGVDLDRFNPKGKIFPTKLKKPIILCVSALNKTKRVDLVIKAVSKLKNVSLLLIGDGELKSSILKKGRLLLGNRFELLSVPFKDMPDIYRSADILTIASESFYSFEIVLVEAMATNLAVVANDDPIRRDIVGNAGILVNPANINLFAKTLRSVLEKNWGDIPRANAKRFSWDRISEKYFKLFKELLTK